MEIQLNQLNSEKIKELDYLCATCAGIIFNRIQDFKYKGSFTPYFDESVEKMMVECFEKSKLCINSDTNILEKFQRVLDDLFPSLPVEMQWILYPVLFYTLILKNECNPKTIASRKARKTMWWGNTTDLMTIPVPKYLYLRKEEKAFDNRCKKLELAYRPYKKSAVPPEPPCMEHITILDHAETALMFAGHYADIVDIQYNARVGLLALELLDITHRTSRPMDTVLRIFLFERISGIISAASKICNDFLPERYDSKGIILDYYTHGGPQTEVQLSKRGYGKIRERLKLNKINVADTADLLNPESTSGKQEFHFLYNKITQDISLSEKEVLDMVNYFFDKKQLIWYSDFYQEIMLYMEAITDALEGKGIFDENRFRLCNGHYWEKKVLTEVSKEIAKRKGTEQST